jgi:hypothetical protein
MRDKIVPLSLIATILVVHTSVCAQSRPSEQMQNDIRELMQVTGAAALAVQMMQQVISQMQQVRPEVPEEFWIRFIAKADTDELIEMIVPIYARHFTPDEIKGLLDFYRTPLGRKVIATLPAIVEESADAGEQWGEQLSKQVVEELEREGYK